MIDGLQHVGTNHKCSVCQCDFTDDEGGIQGYLGIIPVAFCPTCYGGIFDMVEQLEDREWVGLTVEEIEEIGKPAAEKDGSIQAWGLFALAIEAKLKEKNT